MPDSAPTTSAPDPDDAVVGVLDLVERTYVDPVRIVPERMLDGALRGIRHVSPLLQVAGVGGERAVTGPGGTHALPAAGPWTQGDPPGTLGRALAGPLAALLAAASAPDPAGQPSRDVARAATLHGALRTLDRWSTASTAGGRERLLRRQRGTVAGVGLRIGRRDGEVRVLAVIPDSGADSAGILPGDVLLEADGRSLAELVVGRILALLRGGAGSHVALRVRRDGKQLTFAVERRPFEDPTVTARLVRQRVAVLAISHFSKRTSKQVARALAALRGRTKVDALILDLRGNTGGSMLAAAGVADQLVTRGVLIEALDRRDRAVPGLQARVEATAEGDRTTPVALLVDARSASSSELLAACLTRHDRALLVGAPTFGKNIVGKLHHFPAADLSVKLSSATMRAAGREVPATGLDPDVWVVSAGAEAPADALVLAGDLASAGPLERLAALLLAHGSASRASTREALSRCSAVARGTGAARATRAAGAITAD